MYGNLALQMTLKQVLKGKGNKAIFKVIRGTVELISKRKCSTNLFLAWVFGALARDDIDVVGLVGWPVGNFGDVVKEALMCASPLCRQLVQQAGRCPLWLAIVCIVLWTSATVAALRFLVSLDCAIIVSSCIRCCCMIKVSPSEMREVEILSLIVDNLFCWTPSHAQTVRVASAPVSGLVFFRD